MDSTDIIINTNKCHKSMPI